MDSLKCQTLAATPAEPGVSSGRLVITRLLSHNSIREGIARSKMPSEEPYIGGFLYGCEAVFSKPSLKFTPLFSGYRYLRVFLDGEKPLSDSFYFVRGKVLSNKGSSIVFTDKGV